MFNIFEPKTSGKHKSSQQKLNWKVLKPSTVNFDEKSLKVLSPKIWNNVPPHIKNAENLSVFERLIKAWDV